ncbi:peptidoglycan-binding protein [Streptomyces sp. I4(2020)]|uniref:peptidoglycan-binding domain-containing protein n=1 Tax=Streptomyces sp. I4(2020) TaxID=2760981 RepID=UPI0018EE5D92|nr:peptidoglycan-binding domain-containing protein [Streptomyces sp. I4(2020)]MBJ6613491.1 peptidoglycan-binding protein [Streptomyces sp. I3(2020)]MBJ6629802.1 peptidoglycan-binding protein [Streptomyces sp. I4(2020)]
MTSPPGSGPAEGPPLEPVRVLRARRTDALAELFREVERGDGVHEEVPPDRPPAGAEDVTQELPPVPGGPPPFARPSRLRRAAPVLVVAVAALAGFGGALLFTERPADDRAAVPASPPAAAAPAPPRTAAPAEDGFLREGDAGPDVAALQERLLRVPDVYRDGRTDGRYDATLREAVARFQLWYGVRGDETGVYGDDTRRALESHTDGPGGDDAA